MLRFLSIGFEELCDSLRDLRRLGLEELLVPEFDFSIKFVVRRAGEEFLSDGKKFTEIDRGFIFEFNAIVVVGPSLGETTGAGAITGTAAGAGATTGAGTKPVEARGIGAC